MKRVKKFLLLFCSLLIFICVILPINAFAETISNNLEDYSYLETTETTMSSDDEPSSRSLISAGNALGYNIVLSSSPQSYSVDINITKVSRPTTMTFIMKNVRTIDNKVLGEYKKVITVSKVGHQNFQWNLPVSSTVEESMTCNLSWSNVFSRGSNRKYILRMNTDGGAYNKLSALDGQRHHIPSQAALKANNISVTTAPAIRMTIADHKKTASYGSSSTAKNFVEQEKNLLKQGKFAAAQSLGIQNIRKLFPYYKYEIALMRMVAYTAVLGWK